MQFQQVNLHVDDRVRRSPAMGRKGQRGQVATEYMLVISVMVIGIVYVTYTMFDSSNGPVKQALDGLLGGGESSASSKNIPNQIERGYISEGDPL